MKLDFCAICGRTDTLEHHHFVPRGLGGADVDTNLLTLCADHHGAMHEMRRRSDIRALTKAALAALKARGVRLGSGNPRAGGEATRRRWAKFREASAIRVKVRPI
jgi:hypothetical protein